jgi:hypothetical protein
VKARTFEQTATAKTRAANFVRNVLGDDDRAAEIEDESVEHYAERKQIRIVDNPASKGKRDANDMAKTTTSPSKAELQETIDAIAEMVGDALNPVLSREEVVEKLQAMDNYLNGDDADDADDDDTDDDDADDE